MRSKQIVCECSRYRDIYAQMRQTIGFQNQNYYYTSIFIFIYGICSCCEGSIFSTSSENKSIELLYIYACDPLIR